MRSGRSRSLVALLGTMSGLTALSIDMSLPALPRLTTVFGTSAEEASLTLSMFLIGYSISQLVYGPLSDRFGRRLPLLVGLVLFAAGGIGCTISTSMTQLIGWRLLQGIGACSGPIMAYAVVRDLYERRRAAQILSYITLIRSVAPLLAPIVGGYLLLLDWRVIFAALASVGLAVLTAAWRGLPETIPRRDPRALQPAMLLRHLFDFLRRPVCIGYALLICFVFCGLFSYISGSPFVLIEVFGIPSSRYGYVFGLSALAMMSGAFLNTRLVSRVAATTILRLGVALIVTGGVGIATCAVLRLGGIVGVVGPMLVYIVGMGMVMPNAIAGAMEPVPHMAGFASSLIGCLQMAGGSFAGYLVGVFYDHTALPLALSVAVSAALAGITFFTFLGSLSEGRAGSSPRG